MSDLDNAINSINASAVKAENTAGFLDDMSTFDDQSSVTNPNNGQTVASIPKQVKDRTDELFTAAESEINQAVADAEQSATDAQDAADSIGRYQGLWPDTGGSANKGDTYQTQVSGTPTGKYFTALQNTTADPVGDDVNWRGVVSFSSVSNLNLIPNSDFSIAGSVANAPDATPRSYSADDELFQGFRAVSSLSGVTYVNGKLNGTGQLYVDVYKTEKQKLSTVAHVASIATMSLIPFESGASFVDNGEYWRVTFDMTDTVSVKFEQGAAATSHYVGSGRLEAKYPVSCSPGVSVKKFNDSIILKGLLMAPSIRVNGDIVSVQSDDLPYYFETSSAKVYLKPWDYSILEQPSPKHYGFNSELHEDASDFFEAALSEGRGVLDKTEDFPIKKTVVFTGDDLTFDFKVKKQIVDIDILQIDGLTNSKFYNCVFDGNNDVLGGVVGGYGDTKNNVAFAKASGKKSKSVWFINCVNKNSQNRGYAGEVSASSPGEWTEDIYIVGGSIDNNANMGSQFNNGQNIHHSMLTMDGGVNTGIQYGGNVDKGSISKINFKNYNPNPIGNNAANVTIEDIDIEVTKTDTLGSSGEYCIFSYKTTASNGDNVTIRNITAKCNLPSNDKTLGVVYLIGGNNCTIDNIKGLGRWTNHVVYCKWVERVDSSDPIYHQRPLGLSVSNVKATSVDVPEAVRLYQVAQGDLTATQAKDVTSIAIRIIDSNIKCSNSSLTKSGAAGMGGIKVEGDSEGTQLVGNGGSGVNVFYDDETKKYTLTPTYRMTGSVTIPSGASSVVVTTNAGSYAASISSTANYDSGPTWATSSTNSVTLYVTTPPSSDKAIYYSIDYVK